MMPPSEIKVFISISGFLQDHLAAAVSLCATVLSGDFLFYRHLLCRNPSIAPKWLWAFIMFFAVASIPVFGLILRWKLMAGVDR